MTIDPRELDRLTNAITTATQTAPLQTAALNAMHDARNGWPSISDGNSRSGTPTSPVEALAGAPDLGAQALRHYHADLRQATLALERLVAARQAWTPRKPTTTEQRVTSPDPGTCCDRCGRAEVHTRNPTTVSGRLDTPHHLCRPCYDYISRTKHTPGVRTNKHAGH